MSIAEWLDDPNGDGNSEAASEKPPKPRRGRPRVTPPEWDEAAWRFGFGQRSRKTIRKRFLAIEALRVLEKAEGQDFRYLTGPDKAHWEILKATMLEAAAVIFPYQFTDVHYKKVQAVHFSEHPLMDGCVLSGAALELVSKSIAT